MVTDPARAEKAAIDRAMNAKTMKATSAETTNMGDAHEHAKRVDRLPKPNREGFAAKIAELTELTEAKQRRIEEIKIAVNAKRDSRKQHANENQPLRDRLGELTTMVNNKISERNALRDEVAANDERRNGVREEANAMRAASKFLTNESIDAEIARIDHKISHETISLTEEKKLIDQIKSLNKNREIVKEYSDKQVQIATFETTRKTFMERIREKDAEINALKADQTKIRSTLDASKGKDDESNADVPALIEEKNAAYEVIKATREEMRVLRETHKVEEDKYWAREKQFLAFQKAEKQKKWEAGQEERKAREEERKRWEIENAPEPYEEEVAACDSLLAYMSKFDPRATKKEEGNAAAAMEVVTKSIDGMKLLNRDGDDDDMFAVTASYNKKNKKPSTVKKVKSSDDELLQFSLDTLGCFAKISVNAVSKTSEVPAVVDTVKAKKEEFLERRRMKKERIAAGLPDEEEEEKASKVDAGKEQKASSAKEKKNGNGAKKSGKSKKADVSVTLTIDNERVIVALIVN